MTHRTCLVPSIAKLAIYGGLALGMSAGVQQLAYAETMSVASETGSVRSASGSTAPGSTAPASESNSDPGTTHTPAASASSPASATAAAPAPQPASLAAAPTPAAAPAPAHAAAVAPESSTPDYWLREFKPTLSVAQYAKTTVSAYDKNGKKLDSLDDENAVRYEGTVELNIPVGALLSSPPAAPHEGENGSSTPAGSTASTSASSSVPATSSTPAPADSSEERPDYYNSWPDRKPFESLAHRDKGPVFNYVLSLPDLTTLTPSFATPNPAPVLAPLSWSSATIRNTFAYIDGDTISVSIQGNKAIFSAHTKSGLTWRELFSSKDIAATTATVKTVTSSTTSSTTPSSNSSNASATTPDTTPGTTPAITAPATPTITPGTTPTQAPGVLTFKANYSLTKEQYNYLKDHEKSTHILGAGEYSGEWFAQEEQENTPADQLTGPKLNQYLFYYFTDQMNHSVITGSAAAPSYKELVNNSVLHTAHQFGAGGTVSRVKYSDYTDPAIDKDGYEIHTTFENASFKEALIPLEHWLSGAINDLDSVSIRDYTSTATVTFTLPDALDISPIFQSNAGAPNGTPNGSTTGSTTGSPKKHYAAQGDPTNPTKIIQKDPSARPEFSLEYIEQEGKTLKVKVTLNTSRLFRFGANQLMTSSTIGYKALKSYIQKLSEELEIQFVALRLNEEKGQHGEKYDIKGSVEVVSEGHVVHNGRNVAFKIVYGADGSATSLDVPVEIPYDVRFRFQSGTPGMELPDYIVQRYLTQLHGNALRTAHVYKGKTFSLTPEQLNFSPDVESDVQGSWTFNKSLGWQWDGKSQVRELSNVQQDIELVGTWTYTPYSAGGQGGSYYPLPDWYPTEPGADAGADAAADAGAAAPHKHILLPPAEQLKPRKVAPAGLVKAAQPLPKHMARTPRTGDLPDGMPFLAGGGLALVLSCLSRFAKLRKDLQVKG